MHVRTTHAALAKAHNLAVNTSVTVCDAYGRLVAFQRMDGALAEADRASIETALATSGRISGDESVEDQSYFPLTSIVIRETMPLLRRPGGLPIIRGGRRDDNDACGLRVCGNGEPAAARRRRAVDAAVAGAAGTEAGQGA